MISNIDIRIKIMESGLKYYEIAHEMGMSESYFSRIMRKELTADNHDRVISAISELQKERNITHYANGIK